MSARCGATHRRAGIKSDEAQVVSVYQERAVRLLRVSPVNSLATTPFLQCPTIRSARLRRYFFVKKTN
jgi:hypothetical protein